MKSPTLSLFILLLATAPCAQSVEPSELVAFACFGATQFKNCPNGGRAQSIFEASDGNFYGTTQTSEEGFSYQEGGTLFRLTRSGKFTLLFTFLPGVNKNYPNGNLPGSLLEGPDGNLYGTTAYGGSHNVGVLFRISKTGTGFKLLHQFCSATKCADRFFGGLSVATSDGNLYGNTAFGGKIFSGYGCGSIYNPTGCGTFFKFNIATSKYSVIYSFNPATDGLSPGGSFRASDGNFYGIDLGNNFTDHIFRFTLPGTFKVIYTTPIGVLLNIPVTEGADGNLYGISRRDDGTSLPELFEIDRDGSNFRQIASLTFKDTSNFGFLVASDGNLWGLSFDGAGTNQGSVLKISPIDGAVLQTFPLNGKNGQYPDDLIQASSGLLVGTAQGGGTVSSGMADGVVFTLNASLPPAK